MLPTALAPYGGIATIIRHVEILNENGIAAFIGVAKKPPIDFYQTAAPLLAHGGNLKVQRGDIFVIPEVLPQIAHALIDTPVKRLMFCQNQYNLRFTRSPRIGIAELGVHGIVASSQAVRDFFRDTYGLDLPVIPYAIEPALFSPAKNKKRQIAFMPRKLPKDAMFIEAVFKRRYPSYAEVPWISIDGLPRRDAARLMAESECFLSLSHKESFGLPPLEAMACGCLVSGFHGDGGREYMGPENGWWADTGDYRACVDGLAAALATLESGGPTLYAYRSAMAETVRRYSPSNLQSHLLEFWRSELAKDDLPERVGLNHSVRIPKTWLEWIPSAFARLVVERVPRVTRLC